MEARPLTSALRQLARSPAAVPALVAIGVFLALGVSEGGFSPSSLYPATLAILALVVLAVVAMPLGPRPPRAVVAAGLLLLAYAAWSYASIAWADNQGDAWDGANRTLAYALVFFLFAWWPLRARAATTVIAAFGLGTAAVGMLVLLRAGAASDALVYFVGGRFSDPVGYPNGNVALWSLACIPCLVLGARRELPAPLRGLLLAAATLLAGLALLGQSRGWLLTLPLVVAVFLIVAPGRGRNAVAVVVVAGAVYAVSGPLLDVREAIVSGAAPEPPLDSAIASLLLAAAVVGAGGVIAGLLDRRVSLPRPASARVSAGVVTGLVAIALVAVAVTLLGAQSPRARVAAAWTEFTAGGEIAAEEDRLAGSLATNRYDVWRVAWRQFTAHPLAGVGVDNYQQDYLALGATTERPRYPHSLELRVLAQTGIVGALLLGGAVGAALIAALRAAWRTRGLAGAVAGAATAAFGYWGVHGSVDWFWELPALGAPAFAMLGLATAVGPRDGADESAKPIATGRARRALLALGACALLLLLVPPWLAQRQVDAAVRVWPTSPAEAFQRLDRAGSLNPLSSRPAATAGAIALRLGWPYTAEREYRSVLARNPRSAFARLQVGALQSQLGRPEDARRTLERAAELSPRDEITRRALEEAREGRTLEGADLFAEARSRAQEVAR